MAGRLSGTKHVNPCLMMKVEAQVKHSVAKLSSAATDSQIRWGAADL
eukprot:SAG31_NODE_555_length_14169_cov_19.798721_5_plen_47_part_00